MAYDMSQMGTHGLRTGMLVVGHDVAVELVRQALTGRGIAPGDEWQVVDLGSCWSIQNLPVVRFLVTKDTGQVLGSDEQLKTSGLFRRGT